MVGIVVGQHAAEAVAAKYPAAAQRTLGAP